jgi:hypothetical protein
MTVTIINFRSWLNVIVVEGRMDLVYLMEDLH